MNTHFSYTRPYEYNNDICKRHQHDDEVCKNRDASKRQRPQIMPPVGPPVNHHPPIDPPQGGGGGGHQLDLYY